MSHDSEYKLARTTPTVVVSPGISCGRLYRFAPVRLFACLLNDILYLLQLVI